MRRSSKGTEENIEVPKFKISFFLSFAKPDFLIFNEIMVNTLESNDLNTPKQNLVRLTPPTKVGL